MCIITQELKQIAELLIKQEHKAIDKTMTDAEKIAFVNASATIQQHSNFIQQTLSTP